MKRIMEPCAKILGKAGIDNGLNIFHTFRIFLFSPTETVFSCCICRIISSVDIRLLRTIYDDPKQVGRKNEPGPYSDRH